MVQRWLDGEIQRELRGERVAIMTTDGGVTEREANAYCNSIPQVYGYVELEDESGT